jgi:putative copper resistance protein D
MSSPRLHGSFGRGLCHMLPRAVGADAVSIVPGFDFSDSGGLALSLLRGATDGAVLGTFGTLVLTWLVAPPALAVAETPGTLRLGLRRQGVCWAVAAIGLVLVWLVFVAKSLSEAADLPALAAAVGTVAAQTQFGHLVLATLACLLLVIAASVAPLCRDRLAWAVMPAIGAVVLQALHGHALGMGMPLMVASECAHLLAAGAWIGALPAFWLLARRLPPEGLSILARRFSPLGVACVLVLAATAFAQGWALIGSFGALGGTAYGWMALLKLLFFVLLLSLAALNRQLLTPTLAGAATAEAARRHLLASVAMEVVLGLAAILAAGLLASLEPTMPM